MNKRINGENPFGNGIFKGRAPDFIKARHMLVLLIIFLVALNVVLFYTVFMSSQGLPGYRQQCEQVKDLEAKILKIKKENHKLFTKIQGLKNDAQAQEKLVRQQLGWVKPNEMVIEFGAPPPTPQQ